MRVLSLYPHGFTMGTSPTANSHDRAKRGQVTGWSMSATRRNIAFLRSVDEGQLTGYGYGLTLTLQRCPATPEDWHSLRDLFIRRLRRSGLIRFHWVTEWQRRGVPHLHGAFWFEEKTPKPDIIRHWLQLSAAYGSRSDAQHVAKIDDPIGWFKYLSKHAARGVCHYQRSSQNVPVQWNQKTGRIWGYGGEWSTREKSQIFLDDPGYYRLRRIVRNWRIAEARQFASVASFLHKHPERRTAAKTVILRLSGASRRLSQARRMLKCNSRNLSDVRGVSEWISDDLVLMALGLLADQGCRIES
jgi:hypothetical protein